MIPLRPFHFLQFITTSSAVPFSRTSFFHGEPSSLLTYAPAVIISLASPIVLLSPKSANGTERTSTWCWFEHQWYGAADRPRYRQPNAQGRKLGVVREQRSKYFMFSSSSLHTNSSALFVIVHHKGAIMSTGKLELQDVSGLEKIEATASGKHTHIIVKCWHRLTCSPRRQHGLPSEQTPHRSLCPL